MRADMSKVISGPRWWARLKIQKGERKRLHRYPADLFGPLYRFLEGTN